MQLSATPSASAQLKQGWRARRDDFTAPLAPLPNGGQQPTSPVISSAATSASDLPEIETLLHRLRAQRRWVYFFAESTRVRSTHTNILQIPLKSRSRLKEWVQKVIHSKQCCAVVIEKDSLADCPVAIIQRYCQFAGVALIIIQNSAVNRAVVF